MLCSPSASHFPGRTSIIMGEHIQIILAARCLVHLVGAGMLEGPVLAGRAGLANCCSCPRHPWVTPAPFSLGSSGRQADQMGSFGGAWPQLSVLAEFGREGCCVHQINQLAKASPSTHTPTPLPSLWGKGIQVHVGLSRDRH